MANRSVFFNNFQSSQEQDLIEDLIIESINIYGIDAYYLPKTYGDYDFLYGEDDLGTFKEFYTVPMYINTVEGFGGEGDFLSKFGVEQRDTMTMSVARRTFEQDVGREDLANIERPREGDVIFFPLNKKLYTVNFVEHEPVFYQMGSLQFYELRLEMFEYGGERFNTGISDIDVLEDTRSTDIFLHNQLLMETGDLPIHIETGQRVLLDGIGTALDQDDITDSENTFLETGADNFIDFSDADPFSEGGTF
jgi:hypothetical protein